MQEKCFYFISNDYFSKFNDPYLMTNKCTTNKRPCFFAFKDDKNSEIMWLIPISSKYRKYKKIEQEKINKYGHCDNFEFGMLLGQKTVFLIQNICPVTSKYLELYVDKNNQIIRTITKTENNVIAKSRKLLALYSHGIKLIYPNIDLIYKELEVELISNKEK